MVQTVYGRCTSGGEAQGFWPARPETTGMHGSSTVYGGVRQVYGWVVQGCTAGCSRWSLLTLVMFVGRSPVGLCWPEQAHPWPRGHGYHLFSCQQRAPPSLPQVFPGSWQNQETVPTSSLPMVWRARTVPYFTYGTVRHSTVRYGRYRKVKAKEHATGRTTVYGPTLTTGGHTLPAQYVEIVVAGYGQVASLGRLALLAIPSLSATGRLHPV